MKKKSASNADLRKKAESRLPGRAGVRRATPVAERQRLVRELEIHRVELEIQNEELRRARLEAEAGLERYTLLFDFAPTGYLLLRPDGIIREVNHVGAELLGQVRSRLVGRQLATFLAEHDQAAFEAMLVTTLDRDSKESCEVRLVKRREIPLSVQLTARALTRPERMVLVQFHDVTERKVRERAREEAEKMLRELDRRKDEFLAVLSHELRNPLAPIQTSLSVLGRHGSEDGPAVRARAIIDRQVRLLNRLVDDLLDVTRITRGKIRLQRRVVNVVPLVSQTLDDQRPSFEASGLRLEGRVERRAFCVDADAARLVQALSNLLANAEKFTPRGGKVTVIVEAGGRHDVVIRVRDTGAGVEPELLSQLFEPFVQGPQTLDRSRGGVGLGLAMVKGLVELHGGEVAASSAGRGRGTEITLRLPLAEAVPAAAKAGGEPAARPTGPRRVLVIDDNVDNVESMQIALEKKGHEVRAAYDGPSGLAAARRFEPDVIISDLGLPEMDGYAVARVARADPALKDTYLIALSGYARPEDLERSVDAGFDRHLGKPASLEQLDDLISRAPVRAKGRGRERAAQPSSLR